MSTLTTIWQLIKPASTDQVRDLDDQLRTLVDRLDYLYGEVGSWLSPATAGTSTTTINLSRPYPNGFQAFAQVSIAHSGEQITCWTTAQSNTGGPGGVGQFTLGVNTTAATARLIKWHVRPTP